MKLTPIGCYLLPCFALPIWRRWCYEMTTSQFVPYLSLLMLESTLIIYLTSSKKVSNCNIYCNRRERDLSDDCYHLNTFQCVREEST